MKRFFAKCLFFLWVIAVWVFIIHIINSVCFGATRRQPRYKIAPTNCVVRVDGTNCYVRYMRDLLLNTNLVISCEPFDPAPASRGDNTNEGEPDEE